MDKITILLGAFSLGISFGLQTFASGSVNYRVLFWVEDVDVWITIRDQVMRRTFKAFKENGVEIPFPQQDLHVKSFPCLIK